MRQSSCMNDSFGFWCEEMVLPTLPKIGYFEAEMQFGRKKLKSGGCTAGEECKTYTPYLSPTVMKLSALNVSWNMEGPVPRRGCTYRPGDGCNVDFLFVIATKSLDISLYTMTLQIETICYHRISSPCVGTGSGQTPAMIGPGAKGTSPRKPSTICIDRVIKRLQLLQLRERKTCLKVINLSQSFCFQNFVL